MGLDKDESLDLIAEMDASELLRWFYYNSPANYIQFASFPAV